MLTIAFVNDDMNVYINFNIRDIIKVGLWF